MATAAAADAANPSPAGLIADINSIEKRVQGSVKTFTDINNLMERLFRNPDVNFTSEDVPDKVGGGVYKEKCCLNSENDSMPTIFSNCGGSCRSECGGVHGQRFGFR